MSSNPIKIRVATFVLGLVALTNVLHARVHATLLTGSTTSTVDCDGNACSQVTLTWEDSTGQYKAQNISTDRIVIVEGSNLAAAARIRVAPSKTEYLPLKSIVGTYHANYE